MDADETGTWPELIGIVWRRRMTEDAPLFLAAHTACTSRHLSLFLPSPPLGFPPAPPAVFPSHLFLQTILLSSQLFFRILSTLRQRHSRPHHGRLCPG